VNRTAATPLRSSVAVQAKVVAQGADPHGAGAVGLADTEVITGGVVSWIAAWHVAAKRAASAACLSLMCIECAPRGEDLTRGDGWRGGLGAEPPLQERAFLTAGRPVAGVGRAAVGGCCGGRAFSRGDQVALGE